MAIQKSLGAAGLWISPSTLQAPVGAYILADNTVINSPGIVECRRGFLWFPYELSGSEIMPHPKASFSFRGTLLVQHNFSLSYNSGVSFTNYTGSYAPPNPNLLRMKAEEMALSFYFTTDGGIKALDSPTSNPIPAGEPRGPSPTSTLHPTALTGAPDAGWMPEDSQSAYVATFFRTDANDIPHEGVPSNPVIIKNFPSATIPAGDAAVSGPDVVVTLSNPGIYAVGDQVTVNFTMTDSGSFTTGTYTISATTLTSITLPGAAAGPGPVTTQAADLITGTKNVQVYVQLPNFAVAGNTILVYRSKSSVGVNVLPRPQYYLDKEYTLVAGDITAGYFTYTDITSDRLLQDALYTNTDDGEPPDSSLQNDDSQPPLCLDLAQFNQRLWGANYQELQTFPFSLLGVGAPNGLVAGDTITINGDIYTAVAEATTPTSLQFRAYTTFDPATNVEKTAQELALQVSSADATIDLYYTSGPDDIVRGSLLARSRFPGDAAFPIWVSRPSAWSPVLTTSGIGALTSTSTPSTNGLWFSKQNQPEAVPLLNRLAIGPRNANILRIRPLRDKLFVFTDIAGTYVVSNFYPYQVTSLSSTAVLVVPDSLVNFDDAIYALTTQGVVRFNEAGPTILSIPIESGIKALFGTGLTTLRQRALGVGYESYRKYMLAMPSTVEDTDNTEVWVYDVVTKSWTRWTKPMDSAVVIPQNDLLYVTTPSSLKVSYERKNYDRTDYSDESFAVTITAKSGETITVTTSIAPQVGDLIYQSPIERALVLGVTNTAANTYALVMDGTVGWTLGAATDLPGIDVTLLNTPLFATGPEERKNFREVTYHFRTPGFLLGRALFAGDTNPAIIQVDFSKGGWGDVAWGLFSWEQPARPVNKRVSIPTNARRVSYLSVGFAIRESQAQWQLMGISPVYENMSERNTK